MNQSTISSRPTIILTAQDLMISAQISEVIKTNAGGRDRAHFKEHSEYISQNGIAAELAVIRMLEKLHPTSVPNLQSEWENSAGCGRNYGRDILKEWSQLSHDIEVKCTDRRPNDGQVSLFMRTPSDSGYKKGRYQHLSKEYWATTLPESYYLLIRIYGFKCQLVGWTTKQRFIYLYNRSDVPLFSGSEPLENQLNGNKEGYPTICMFWKQLYCPFEFLRAVRDNREPGPVLFNQDAIPD